MTLPFIIAVVCALLLPHMSPSKGVGFFSCHTAHERLHASDADPVHKPNSTKIEEGFITTPDGVRLFYQKAGTAGQTIIIPGRLFIFEQARQLADRYTVISYDMRNRGRSDAVTDGQRISIQDDVRDMEIVRQHFGVKRFSLIGYSYLGLMVIMYAMEHPETVDSIIQLGPVPIKFGTKYPEGLTNSSDDTGAPAQAREKLRKLREEGYDTKKPEYFCEQQWLVNRYGLVGNPANVKKLGKGNCDMPNEWPVNLSRHFKYHFTSVQELDIPRDNVSKLATRVLTIHGTKDRNAPYGAGREWAMLLPNCRLLTIEGAAHRAYDEFPEIVFPAIREFLNGRWPQASEKVPPSAQP